MSLVSHPVSLARMVKASISRLKKFQAEARALWEERALEGDFQQSAFYKFLHFLVPYSLLPYSSGKAVINPSMRSDTAFRGTVTRQQDELGCSRVLLFETVRKSINLCELPHRQHRWHLHLCAGITKVIACLGNWRDRARELRCNEASGSGV